ncbi:cytochrome c [Amaricoccus solimangrovi]|uniref:C-type cytochrome n=1 Tax=Amaricoccus solimangrovi TaxID=2589815 RepID=A0A501WWW6_9RHOB|nr:cytochrome c [Amaricoccus solimangrovi]TPE52644.1 c-type cytochrome [Amaricoccus solimangrovi]
MRRILLALLALACLGLAAFYALTIPRALAAVEIAALPRGEAARGERIFWAGGCASCHAAPGAKGDDRLRLGGGRVLRTGFGDFVAPNISNDAKDGIGSWSTADLANAMLRGVSPEGRHLYPSFPYTSYARMRPADIADLRAYLATLPAVAGRQPGHDLRFPFNLRRGLGLWKLAFLSPEPVLDLETADPAVKRGQYLVEGPGHCGECHTPRGFAGELDYARWLGGAPAAEGEGKVPDITPAGDLGGWSAGDIAYYLESGFTPDYDSVGGAMVEVQENMAMLPGEDRDAIAAYLEAVPPVGNPR